MIVMVVTMVIIMGRRMSMWSDTNFAGMGSSSQRVSVAFRRISRTLFYD